MAHYRPPSAERRARILVLVGPTAVGKSGAAVEVAERIGGEIVCADSRTVYRGMDIGTAKPTAQMRARVPHHMLDVADPRDVFTVRDFQRIARSVIQAIHSRGRTPVLVGGTGLYVRAVVDGLDIPEVPPDWGLRQRWEAEERGDPGILYRRLQRLDPGAASEIPASNIRRIIRALEVVHHTGRPMSDQRRRTPADVQAVQVGLTMERAALIERIDWRVLEQVEAGLVEEVRALIDAGVDSQLPAMQGLGYKEIAAYLRGEVELDEAIRTVQRRTRRYAKRQMTWFRADPSIRWIGVDGLNPAEVAERVLRAVS
jgi:tRNA dimethylallyltransferase